MQIKAKMTISRNPWQLQQGNCCPGFLMSLRSAHSWVLGKRGVPSPRASPAHWGQLCSVKSLEDVLQLLKLLLFHLFSSYG